MKYNKEKILMIVGVITLLVFVGGATYAYFVAQGGNSEQTNINVITHTTDSLVFEVGKAISITADQTTFAPGAGNQSDDTFARATLKANNSTNQAKDNYYVYLLIDTNEFKYTTDPKTAELILTVNYKDNEGNVTPITSINGLNYVTVGSVSGFDVTETKGLITIANNYEITSTGTEVDEWDITLTLVNLDSNQTANAGKTFNGTLMIQKEEHYIVLSDVCNQNDNFVGCLKNFNETFDSENTNLYHHTIELANSANDDSYRYSGSGKIAFKEGEKLNFFNDCLNYKAVYFTLNTHYFSSDDIAREYVKFYNIIYSKPEELVTEEERQKFDYYASLVHDVNLNDDGTEAGIISKDYKQSLIDSGKVISEDLHEIVTEFDMNKILSLVVDTIYYFKDDSLAEEKITEYVEIYQKYNDNGYLQSSLTEEEWEYYTNFSNLNIRKYKSIDESAQSYVGETKYFDFNSFVKNYVCFGTDAEKCDDEHLYQIIGVFNENVIGEDENPTGEKEQRIKLIKVKPGKEETLGTKAHSKIFIYAWSGSLETKTSYWPNSTLNTNILNGTYLTVLGTKWTDKIAYNEWKIGGISPITNPETIASIIYQKEITNPYKLQTTNNKIGLMYINDYAYAAIPERWPNELRKNSELNYNWMKLAEAEWTITLWGGSAYIERISGDIIHTSSNADYAVIRPVFYLNSDVTYIGGTGTPTDPYRIA